jgi:phosphate:Na+ symporter
VDGTDYTSIGLGFTGGIVLFLLGARLLADSLREVAEERIKRTIALCTPNRVAAVVTGMVVTACLSSSTAVCIITIGFVHAKLMSLRQAIGVVMGANIGTTISSQIYALDVVQYGPLLMVPGMLMHWLGTTDRMKHVGGAILGLGLVFFAMTYLSSQASPLRTDPAFSTFVLTLENPLMGALVGAAATAVIQSSSAMVGILIALVGQEAIGIDSAIAVMLGAEIGTTFNVLISTAGRSREAIRVGLFQLIFNVVSVSLCLAYITPLAQLAELIIGDNPRRQLAMAQLLFNLASVMLFLTLNGSMARLLERLVPDRASLDAGSLHRNSSSTADNATV